MVAATSRWLGVRADVLCSLFITSIALLAVLVCEDPGMNLEILAFNIKIKSSMPNSAEHQCKYRIRIRFYSICPHHLSLECQSVSLLDPRSKGLTPKPLTRSSCRVEEKYILSLLLFHRFDGQALHDGEEGGGGSSIRYC